MVKEKKRESTAGADETEGKASYEEKLNFVSVIAKPMASKKLTKKVTVTFSYNKTLVHQWSTRPDPQSRL